MANETIGSTGADRVDIATWEAAQSANGTGTCILAEELDTSSVSIDAPYTLTLTANADAYVNAPSRSACDSRVRINVASGAALAVFVTGITVEKIGIIGNSGNNVFIANGSTATTLRRCVVRNGEANIVSFGSVTLTVDNCASFDAQGGGTNGPYSVQGSSTMNCYHCSGYRSNGYVFLISSGTGNAYACVAQGSGGENYYGGWGGDYNVSEDTSAPGSSATKYYRSTSGWFEDTGAGTEDLALAAGAQGKWVTDGKDAIDQTGWPADVATDIVGTARSAPIDPGVWQTPAAPGGSILPLVACDIANMNDMGGFRG